MNRQQAPQPVVRPVQVGDKYEYIDTTLEPLLEGRWYLVSDMIVEGYENQYFPVRVNPKTRVLEYPLDNGDVLFYSGNRQGREIVISEINTDAVSSVDLEELASVARTLGANATTQTNDTPSNVVGFFEQ